MIAKKAVGTFISIKTYATGYSISRYKARKYIDMLMDIGVVEKYHNRFYFISNDMATDPTSIQRKLINKAKINLEISKLINAKLIYDAKFMAFLDVQPDEVIIYYPIRKSKNILKLSEPVIHWEHRLILKRHNIKVK